MKKAKPLLIGGYVKPGFEDVLETFRSNQKSGIERGGSFAAYYHGKIVAHLWGGYSDYDCRRPWKEDTLSTFFSSTKAVASFVIAHLVDRGLIAYEDKVSKYWPEFAQNGKENVTLEQLISNQAGLITLEEPFWLGELRDDPAGLGKKLARQKPYWKPGEKFGYHPLTFGLYLDQVVRHVDKKGRNLSQYFQEEIAEPFGIEFYIGLPKPLTHRATRNILNKQYTRADYDAERNKKFDGEMELFLITGNNPQDFKSVSLLYDIEFYIGLPKRLCHRSTRVLLTRKGDQEELLNHFRGELDLLIATSNNPQDFKTTLKINDPDIRELPCPSTHGHGTAANMAKFFGILANGGILNEQRLMSEEAIRRVTKPIVAGFDCSFGINSKWSLGTQLFTVLEGNKPEYHITGHGGYGGQYAAADLEHAVGFAYTTSFLDPFSSYDGTGDPRMMSLYDSLYKCILQIEKLKVPRVTYMFYSEYKKAMEDKRSKL